MPQIFLQKYWLDNESNYVPMSHQGLFDMAICLIDNPTICPILERAGVHGDFSKAEEQAVDDSVMEYVERQDWQTPHPANLMIGVALARKLVTGSINQKCYKNAEIFIQDRRCDDVRFSNPSTQKPAQLSEIIMIWKLLLQRDDLLAPYRSLRGKKFERGQSWFSEHESRQIRTDFGEFIMSQIQKYALYNRKISAFINLDRALGIFMMSEVHGGDNTSIAVTTALRCNTLGATYVIDDRGVAGDGCRISHR